MRKKVNSKCYMCERRHPACQDKCPDYLAWKANLDATNAKIKDEKKKFEDITPPANATETSRRNAIKAHLLAGGNTNADTVRDMATAMTGYAARVIMNDDYSFTLEFLGETDDLVELDLSSLTDSVNLISPAHLRFIIAGLTWERVEAVNMTWQKLEDMNMTWERLEKSVPIIGSKGD